MKDAVLIGMALVALFSLLSWASAPATTYAEHTKRVEAERQVLVLQTRIAVLLPTPLPNIKCPAWPRC